MTKPFQSALVTGAAGFIGMALARSLAASGVKVYGLVRVADNRSQFLKECGVTVVVEPDPTLKNLQKAFKDKQTETVFHLAAYGVKQDQKELQTNVDVNIAFLIDLMTLTSVWPLKKFVHTGSCFEYCNQAHTKLISEDMPVTPASLYGAAKAASVLYAKALALHKNIPVVVLRLFGVYGPGEFAERLIPYMVKLLQQNQVVDLTSGEQERDYLYIDDVVRGFTMAVQMPQKKACDVYNLCSGTPLKIKDMIGKVAEKLNKPDDLLCWGKRPNRKDEPAFLVGDNRKFCKSSGWQPLVSLDEGIGRVIDSITVEANHHSP